MKLSRQRLKRVTWGKGDSVAYADLIVNTFGANVVAYWPLWEKSGVTAEDYSDNRNGTYRNTAGVLNGVTLNQGGIGDGRTGITLDGTNGYVNVHSASLAGAFNALEGTLFGWVKVDSGVWSDGTEDTFIQLRSNGNNKINIAKGTNRISFRYFAGSGANNLTATVLELYDTAWIPVAFTWSKSNDRIIPYVKGVQSLGETTGLGVWSGALASTRTNIGCDDQTPTLLGKGGFAHWFLLDREATADEILAISRVSGSAWSATQWTVPQYALNTPAVMVTFDDEYESVYTEAFAYMQTKGVRGTFYVMTNAIDGVNDPSFITSAELATMNAAGWSIGNHTTDQTFLADVDIPTATAKMADAKTVLDALGLTRASMHVAYPGGSYDADVEIAAAAAGMLTGRRVYTSPREYPDYNVASNYHIWSTMRLGSGELIQMALTEIDNAIALGKTILFYGHQITAVADETIEWEPWRFKSLINYLGSKNLPFLTINDYYDLQSGSKIITRP